MGKLASSGLSDVIEKGSLKGLPSMAFWLALQDHWRMKALGGVCTLGDSQTHTQWTAWEKFWPWNLLVWFVRILGHNPLTILRLSFFSITTSLQLNYTWKYKHRRAVKQRTRSKCLWILQYPPCVWSHTGIPGNGLRTRCSNLSGLK